MNKKELKKITFCIPDDLYIAFDEWLHLFHQRNRVKITKTGVICSLIKTLIESDPSEAIQTKE